MALPPIVARILESGAPTLLSAIALPPPFNLIASGIVSTLLAKYLPEGEKPEQRLPNGNAALSPDQVTKVIERNAGDPAFFAKLKEADDQLKQFEMANDLKFAELLAGDRKRASDFQIGSGTARPLLGWGMAIVVVSITAMLATVAGSILLVSGNIKIDTNNTQLAVGVFGLIGAVVGYISGYASQVVGFYYGSSQGSNDKTNSLTTLLQQQGQQLGQAVASTASVAATATSATAETAKAAAAAAPKPPQPSAGQAGEQTTGLAGGQGDASWHSGGFGGVRWRVTPDGILDEGEITPERTVGQPVTVRNIWKNYGATIKSACEKHGVPVEVVVTTIAVESRGIATETRDEPDGRQSAGLMQTLTTTASDLLGRKITAQDLSNPDISIEAGVRCIASKRQETGYDPILVAAVYNSGGLYPLRAQDKNPYNLRSTGDHLVRTKLYYNDTVAVAKEARWFA